jgi:hypothetical protein
MKKENLDGSVMSMCEVTWNTKSEAGLLTWHKDGSKWLGCHVWAKTSG